MRRWLPMAVVLAMLVAALPAGAQQADGELTLRIHRDFGYSAGSRIQGAFSLTAEGPQDLTRVDYYIDDRLIGSSTTSPFRVKFNTGDYPLGNHTLAAVGTTASGAQLRSTDYSLEFISAEAGWQSAAKFALPLLGLILLITLLGTVFPALANRGKPFRLGEYGAAGGAVCPRCGLPYSRHALAPNLLLGKLERCPHCGKWAVVGAASAQALEQAEARWEEDSRKGEIQTSKDEDHLRDLVDESRYDP